MKRVFCMLLAAALCLTGTAMAVEVDTSTKLDVKAGAAILMEKETGTILYEENSHTKLEPASVTKVMTLLLVMEAIDTGRLKKDDVVSLSATAERDGMELIAVVMKSPTSGDRFEAAKALLNYGFSNYAMTQVRPGQALPPVQVLLGEKEWVQPTADGGGRILVRKEDQGKITTQLSLPETVEAPVESGQKLGEVIVLVDDAEECRIPLIASEPVPRLTFGGIFSRMLSMLFLAG